MMRIAMTRVVLTSGLLALSLLVVVLWRTARASSEVPAEATALAVAPPEAEVRTFAVQVDGKPSGTYTISSRKSDDVIIVTNMADVLVRKGPFKYQYTFRSTESWKDGKVIAFESTTNDDGKRKTAKGTATADGLTMTANGVVRAGRSNVLTTTGWVPPDPKGQDAILLDTEEGAQSAVKVQALGPCQVVVNGKVINGQKYRLTGKDIDTEWWFDANGRPIHQRMAWDGHKVVLDLTSVR
jgi:hypothetical protein